MPTLRAEIVEKLNVYKLLGEYENGLVESGLKLDDELLNYDDLSDVRTNIKDKIEKFIAQVLDEQNQQLIEELESMFISSAVPISKEVSQAYNHALDQVIKLLQEEEK